MQGLVVKVNFRLNSGPVTSFARRLLRYELLNCAVSSIARMDGGRHGMISGSRPVASPRPFRGAGDEPG